MPSTLVLNDRRLGVDPGGGENLDEAVGRTHEQLDLGAARITPSAPTAAGLAMTSW
jgi:hypothetical protein